MHFFKIIYARNVYTEIVSAAFLATFIFRIWQTALRDKHTEEKEVGGGEDYVKKGLLFLSLLPSAAEGYPAEG